MGPSALLADAFGRVHEGVRYAVEGLDADDLARRIAPDTNSIAWLVWHLSRVQDHQVAEIAGREQVWTAQGWHGRSGLPAGQHDTGYGHTPEQVARVRPEGAGVLLDYYDAVAAHTAAYLETVDEDELDRVIDRSWDPPVTVGVRLVSVIGDCLQHAGQAAYVRGIIDRQA